MNIINPYELFGVTINTSISELKKIYYDLASLCHPDKGGNKNDMIIIKQAYEYIKKQLSNSENRLSLEEIQHDFDKYRNRKKELDELVALDCKKMTIHKIDTNVRILSE